MKKWVVEGRQVVRLHTEVEANSAEEAVKLAGDTDFWLEDLCDEVFDIRARESDTPIPTIENWTDGELEAIKRIGRLPLILNLIKG